MLSRPKEAAWRLLARSRLKAHWLLKLIGMPGFLAVFFLGYFLVLNFPGSSPVEMPVTALDRLVGFHPGALVLYVSLWIYVFIPPSLMGDRSELIGYALFAAGLALAGLAVFLLWPTSVPVFAIDWKRYEGFAYLKSVDQSETPARRCTSHSRSFRHLQSAGFFGRSARRGCFAS